MVFLGLNQINRSWQGCVDVVSGIDSYVKPKSDQTNILPSWKRDNWKGFCFTWICYKWLSLMNAEIWRQMPDVECRFFKDTYFLNIFSYRPPTHHIFENFFTADLVFLGKVTHNTNEHAQVPGKQRKEIQPLLNLYYLHHLGCHSGKLLLINNLTFW